MQPARTPTERRREAPRLLLLLGLAAALGSLLAWERWSDGSGPTPPQAAVAQDKPAPRLDDGAASAQDAHALADLALADLSDTVRRPLFEKKRRPVEQPKTAVATPAAPVAAPKHQADPNALTLQGVILNEGHSAIALMRRTATGQSVRLQEGDTMDGWTVERIETNGVHLAHDDVRITLQLFAKR